MTYVLPYPEDKLVRCEGTTYALRPILNPSQGHGGVLALHLSGALLFHCAPATQRVGGGCAALTVGDLRTLLQGYLEYLQGVVQLSYTYTGIHVHPGGGGTTLILIHMLNAIRIQVISWRAWYNYTHTHVKCNMDTHVILESVVRTILIHTLHVMPNVSHTCTCVLYFHGKTY